MTKNANINRRYPCAVCAIIMMFSLGSVTLAAESGRIISVSPSSFQGGVATTVTVTVQNTGDSDDMIIECDSKPSGWTVSPSSFNPYMPSGGYYNAHFTVTAPVSGGSGIIVWKLYADGIFFDVLLDTYNQNVTATSSLSDLIVEDISLMPTQVYPGNTTFERTVRVKNNGVSTSGPCHLRIQTSGFGVLSDTKTVPIPLLSPGQSYPYQDQLQANFPSIGNYALSIFAEADCYDEVVESNENNNTRQETFIINVGPEPLPDLTITDISVGKSELLPGELLPISIITRNLGSVSAPSCTLMVRIYVDGSLISQTPTPHPPLNPGVSYNFSKNITLPTLSPGSHTIRIYAHIDYYNEVEESNENNNIRDESFPIVIVGIQVLKPNGGEELPVDSNSIVQWQTYGTIPTVNLDVSIDGGATWEILESDLANTGQYEWIVTEYWISPTCLLRISDASNSSLNDESDGTFQIFVCTLRYDLDGNCFIDFKDMALLASEWLQSGNPYRN